MKDVLERVLKSSAPEALVLALEAWRVTRAPEIAVAVHQLGAECEPEQPSFRRKADFHAHWLEVARAEDCATAGWLGQTLMHWLPGSSDEQIDPLLERLEALVWHRDPRVTAHMLAHIETNPMVLGFVDAGDALRAQLPRALDVALLEELRALVGRVNTWEAERLQKLAKQIGAVEVNLDLPTRRAWAAAFPTLDPAELVRQREALFAAAVAAPDEDAPRAVLADWLQDQGDPYGDFVALRLREEAGHATAAEIRRTDALLKEHRVAWLGGLSAVVYRAWYRRGMLDVLELDGSWTANPEMWEQHAVDPLLHTVSELAGKAVTKIQARFVLGGQLVNLRRIWADPVLLEALAERPPPRLERLSVHGAKSTDWVNTQVLAFLKANPGCCGLRVDIDQAEAVLGAELTWLSLHGPLAEGLSRCAGLEHITRVELGWDEDRGLALERTSEGILATAGENALGELKTRLPKEVTRLVVISKQMKQKQAQALFPRVQVEVLAPVRRSGKVTGLRR